MDRKQLGLRLKQLRKQKGLSQCQLADLMGYKDHSTLAKIETGINDITIENLYKYASILEVDVSEILLIKSELDIFDEFCKENKLDIVLSTIIPKGYECANGMFDIEKKTLFFNVEHLKSLPYHERLFYLFYELRHADQYLNPQKYNEEIIKSSYYSIMYDGTCSKLINGKWCDCKLEGDEDYFINLYLSQPYEIDANTFAHHKVKEIFGDLKEIDNLLDFWLPKQKAAKEVFEKIYQQIDELII